MKPIARLDDTLIAVRATGRGGQEILLQATPQGRRLARFLAGAEEPWLQKGFFVVPHDDDVDRRLYLVIDTLIAVRWGHPTNTQLVLDLQPKEDDQCQANSP